MTIAIAALCGFPNDVSVIAAEDHMITSGDIEFEQPQPKMWRLGSSCVAMIFGTTVAQTQIAAKTEGHMLAMGIVDVATAAESYAWFFRDYVRREAEADVLAPLMLSAADLLRVPPTVNPALLRRLTKQMQTYYHASGIADDFGGAIIIGSDATGGHMYRVEHGHATYIDNIGFAAAGSGQWHAESQFMFSRYTRQWSFPDALSLLYAAKKRAEVAPGVGSETDIVIITTNPKNVIHAGPTSDLVKGLEAIYQEHKKKMDEDFAGQHKQVKVFMDELLKVPTPPPAQPPPPTVDVSGSVIDVTPIETHQPPTTPTPPPKRKKAAR